MCLFVLLSVHVNHVVHAYFIIKQMTMMMTTIIMTMTTTTTIIIIIFGGTCTLYQVLTLQNKLPANGRGQGPMTRFKKKNLKPLMIDLEGNSQFLLIVAS